MKSNVFASCILVLLLLTGCYSNRYLLKNDAANSKFLVQTIKENRKKGFVSKKPIIVLDGIPYRWDYELKDSSLLITQKEIQSIDILKYQTAVKIYGDFGKRGVILITTKNHHR